MCIITLRYRERSPDDLQSAGFEACSFRECKEGVETAHCSVRVHTTARAQRRPEYFGPALAHMSKS